MTELADKTAIVTGASRGIGRAAALALAKAGARVMASGRDAAALDAVAAAIRSAGGAAETRICDVADPAAVAELIEATRAAFQSVDILVNNAGLIDPIARLADSEPEAWTRAFDVNAKGVYYGLRAALPVMIAQGSGVVVNVSSGAATSALEGWSHYCSSKAAALALTRCAHLEVAAQGVRVVGLSPGTVATDMQRSIKASGVNPVSRLDWDAHIPPEWAGAAIVWLCTDAAADVAGTDFALRDPENRRRVGLI